MNVRLTFHDVDQGAHVTLLDDAAVLAVLHRIHAVHDLLDLRLLQVLHEVIVLDGLLDEILGPGGKVKGNEMLSVRLYWVFGLFYSGRVRGLKSAQRNTHRTLVGDQYSLMSINKY